MNNFFIWMRNGSNTPDSKEYKNKRLFVQVSISGDELDVEKARNILRNLSPITLQFHLPHG